MNRYNFEAIGKRIKEERDRRNISQDGFIEMLGARNIPIGRNRLSNIENGKCVEKMELEKLVAICDIFQWDVGYLLGEYKEQTQDKHFICQQTGLSEKAIDFLLPHSKDWQTGVLSLLLEEYPDFLQVLANIYTYYGYYAELERQKNTFNNESRLVQHEEKSVDTNDWDKLFEIENTRTVFRNTIERHAAYVKALRLSVFESFIAVVDKIVAKQYKKHSKPTK